MSGKILEHQAPHGGPPAVAESRYRGRVWLFLWVALCGVVLIETVNSARVFSTAEPPRRFPYDYVSKGVWSCYGWIRPPDVASEDLEAPLRAAIRLRHGDPALYAEFDGAGVDFVYPPSGAALMLPFGFAAESVGTVRIVQIVDVLNRGCMLLIILLSISILRRAAWTTAQLGMFAVIILLCFPVRWAVVCVNVQCVINTCLALALVAYAGRREVLCGAALAVAICVKPYYLLLTVFLLIRGRLRTLATAGVLVLGVTALSVGFGGLTPWRTYIADVLPVMSHGHAIWGNQTVTGVLRRWVGDEYVMAFEATSPAVLWTSRALALPLLVGACWPRWRETRRSAPQDEATAMPVSWLVSFLDVGIALLAITLASPIAWDHHYGWAPILFAGCLAATAHLTTSVKYVVVLATACALYAADWVPVGAGRTGIITLLDSTDVAAVVLLGGTAWLTGKRLASSA